MPLSIYTRNPVLEQIVADGLREIVGSVDRLTEQIKRIVGAKPPTGLTYKITAERITETMAHVMIFDVKWDAAHPGDDIAKRTLSMSVDGSTPVVTEYAVSDTGVSDLEAPVNSTVTLSLKNVDGSGNESAEDTITFVLNDTIPPPAATGLGVTVKSERVDPDPA